MNASLFQPTKAAVQQRPASIAWGTVAALLVAVYLGSAYFRPLGSWRVDMYLVRPLAWLLPAAVVLFLLGSNRRSVLGTKQSVFPALGIGVIQVGLLFSAGFLLGLGHSPYRHDPLGIVSNVWYAGALLVGREVARWYIVSALRRRSEALAIGVTTVLLWLVSLSPHAYSLLLSSDTSFDYLGRIALPLFAASLLASYLALLDGPLASMSYLGVLAAFEWLSPILPDLPWPVAALIGVMVPVLGLLFFMPEDEAATGDEAEASGGISKSWLVAALLTLLVVWFNTGVFGVRPVLVQGISMEPGFHTGDVVIIKPVDVEMLAVGDIIKFRDGNHDVLHRIIDIRREESGLVFIAQGDNNPNPDSPVAAADVDGRLVLHIPKVGLPGTYLKRLVTALIN